MGGKASPLYRTLPFVPWRIQGMSIGKKIPVLSLHTAFWGPGAGVAPWHIAAKVAGRGTESASYLGS